MILFLFMLGCFVISSLIIGLLAFFRLIEWKGTLLDGILWGTAHASITISISELARVWG